MRTAWLGQRGRSSALVFFAGWGMDERPFRGLTSAHFDVLVCCDYRHLATAHREPAWAAMSDYDELTVVAWSLGCAAAAALVPQLGWRPRAMVAVNGTVTAEDDDLGIPSRWITATADQLLHGGWSKFVRRMCPDAAARADFEAAAPARDLDGAVDELQELRQLKTPPPSGFTRALIGTRDRIIAPANQRRCWQHQGVPFRHITAPHYPFHLWSTWEDLLAERGIDEAPQPGGEQAREEAGP